VEDVSDARGLVESVLVGRIAVRPAERTQFLTRLRELTRTGNVRVVGTLRADRETELWASPLGKIWDRARFPLADMTQDELREAIEIPAEQQGLTFEPPAMVDRLINAVMTMPGALPLLSFTLHKLYVDCLQRASNDRKLVELADTGAASIGRALREHTDRIYAGFDDATRDTMRRVLVRMVSVTGGAISRRRVPICELELAEPVERARVHAVLDALTGRTEEHDLERTPPTAEPLAAHSLRLAVRGGSRGGGFVELAHDAVVRDWPQFRAWLRDASDDLPLHRAVTASADQWAGDRRHAGYLWRDDPRLPLAERLLASPHLLNQLETAFLVQSRAARHRRNLNVLRAAIAIAVTGAVLAGIMRDRDSAAEQRHLASEHERLIETQRALAQSQRERDRLQHQLKTCPRAPDSPGLPPAFGDSPEPPVATPVDPPADPPGLRPAASPR